MSRSDRIRDCLKVNFPMDMTASEIGLYIGEPSSGTKFISSFLVGAVKAGEVGSRAPRACGVTKRMATPYYMLHAKNSQAAPQPPKAPQPPPVMPKGPSRPKPNSSRPKPPVSAIWSVPPRNPVRTYGGRIYIDLWPIARAIIEAVRVVPGMDCKDLVVVCGYPEENIRAALTELCAEKILVSYQAPHSETQYAVLVGPAGTPGISPSLYKDANKTLYLVPQKIIETINYFGCKDAAEVARRMGGWFPQAVGQYLNAMLQAGLITIAPSTGIFITRETSSDARRQKIEDEMRRRRERAALEQRAAEERNACLLFAKITGYHGRKLDEARVAYRSAARRLHPDVGGSSEEFAKLVFAWEAFQKQGGVK